MRTSPPSVSRCRKHRSTVGAARAFQMRGEDRICLVSFGDGGTSSLGFHSGMNFAGVWKAPVVFLCQNNGWAISCPVEGQTASAGFAVKAQAYGMPGVTVDGNDLLAVRKAVSEAVANARAGGGPTLIEARTYRMGGHSTSDDPTKYVPQEELALASGFGVQNHLASVGSQLRAEEGVHLQVFRDVDREPRHNRRW